MPKPKYFLNEADGESLSKLAKRGIGGWILAVAMSIITGTREALSFLFIPFRIGVDIVKASVEAFILTPMGITGPAFEYTAEGLKVFGFLAGPLSIGIAMASLFAVILYVSRPETSNFLPGLLFDIPPLSWLTNTGEEEKGDEG